MDAMGEDCMCLRATFGNVPMWQLCNGEPGGGGRFILLTSCCACSSILLTHWISWASSTSSLYNIHTNEARHRILQPVVHGESWLPANLHSLHTHLSFPFLSGDLLLGSWDRKYQPVVSVLICYFLLLVVEPIHELLQPYYVDVGSWVVAHEILVALGSQIICFPFQFFL
jgi:hypothetical protein